MTESLIKLSLLQLTVVQQCSTASTFDSMRSFEITSIAFRFHSVRVPHFRPDVFFQKPNHCRKICSFEPPISRFASHLNQDMVEDMELVELVELEAEKKKPLPLEVQGLKLIRVVYPFGFGKEWWAKVQC